MKLIDIMKKAIYTEDCSFCSKKEMSKRISSPSSYESYLHDDISEDELTSHSLFSKRNIWIVYSLGSALFFTACNVAI